MKKISLGIIILTAFLTIAPSVFALNPSGRETGDTIRESIKEEKEVKEKNENKGLLDKVKNFLKKNLQFEARVKGKITTMAIGSNNFSMIGEDGTFQVNITDKTQILRKFGGKSSLSEYSIGDKVMVFGKFTDDTKSIIDAKTIKNNSIQKRKGAFFGKVTVKSTDNFIMDTLERGTQTVYFGSAKFVKRNEEIMFYADLKVGDRVRVKGVWDQALNKINEVTQIKDFSLPVIKPTPTGSI